MTDLSAAFKAVIDSLIARAAHDSDAAQKCFELLSLERLERASNMTSERLGALTSNLIDGVVSDTIANRDVASGRDRQSAGGLPL